MCRDRVRVAVVGAQVSPGLVQEGSRVSVERVRAHASTQYNYLTSAALDGGSQVILFILVRCLHHARDPALMCYHVTELRSLRSQWKRGRVPELVGEPGWPVRR